MPEERCKERQSQALFNGAWWLDQRQWARTEAQGFLDIRKQCEGNHALAHGAQSSCGISIVEDLQKPSGCPGQPPLGEPSWAEELDWTTFRCPCQPQPLWSNEQDKNLSLIYDSAWGFVHRVRHAWEGRLFHRDLAVWTETQRRKIYSLQAFD